MVYADLHMHSSHSEDSDAGMESMIESSIEKGLKCICFTEHMDMDFPQNEEGLSFEVDTDEYHSHYLECREKYAERIKILFGIEYGLQKHLTKRCSEYVNSYPFDMVIGSSHIVNGKDPYYSMYYEGRSEREAYLEYFESVLENVKLFDDFDIYGHLDYVVRYGPNKDKFYSYSVYSDILDEILINIIKKGKGIEINTGGLFCGRCSDTNPCPDIVKRYKELKGEIITVGADAHKPDAVGYAFDRAENILKEAGFEYYCIFENRRPEFIKLL
ncbi:MAG: histidinol-phosphatase HisJ family protein [Lachnospiraceae bacterium]|nr:histidinol-phosphatase HisJ family protein [Lachnospiraceae bacterium]